MKHIPMRRKVLSYAAAGCLALGLGVQARAADDIVIGGSMPMTGVFAFAGIALNNAFQDYVKIVNDAGGTIRMAGYSDTVTFVTTNRI